MAHRAGDLQLNIALSDGERAVIMQIMARDPLLKSRSNVLRAAVWSLADDMGIEMADGVFDLREGYGLYARAPRVTAREQVKRFRSCRKPVKELAIHPWRTFPKRASVGSETGASYEARQA